MEMSKNLAVMVRVSRETKKKEMKREREERDGQLKGEMCVPSRHPAIIPVLYMCRHSINYEIK